MMIRPKDTVLNDGVSISWIFYDGKVVGGFISHPSDDVQNLDGICSATFWIKGFERTTSKRALWDFNGDYEKPTLTPSFLCWCNKFHCYITDGVVKIL
jgi:hypothetical protein